MYAPINRLFTLTFSVLIFTLTSSVALAQQEGTIRGKVTNANQEAIPDINIGLEGTSLGDASNDNGNFVIRRIPAGTYTIVASGVGHTTENKEITIKPGQLLNVNVQLSRSNQQLQEIVVSAGKINKFSTESSEYVAKMPIKDIDNPQVYNTISSEVLNDQVITTFDDALKNAPGVFKLWESTGRGGDGTGFYSIRGFAVQPQMTNGLPSLTNGSPDPVNVERVEIIKGPSATLFGNSVSSYGGLINVVTKKPYDTLGGEVSYKTGSFGMNRVTADINTPVSNDIFLRVNTAYDKRNSFQNAGFSESFFIAPSLQYVASEDLSFSVNTEFYRPESTNPMMLFINRSEELEANNPDELDYDNDLSYTTNDLTIKNPTFSLQGQMNYDISDAWHSQTVVSSSSAQADGYYSYVSTIGLPQNTYGRYISDQNVTDNSIDIQQNFTGDFNLGGINNRLLIGLDFLQQNAVNNSTGYITYDTIDLQNPNPASISKAAADTMLANAAVSNSKTEQQVYSAYISDVIEILPQLSAMASVRLDHFNNDGSVQNEDDDFEQTTLSPKFGIVLKPIPEQLSLFANYMNSFNNVGPISTSNETFTFSPERANQWETGIKTNLFNGKLDASLSYYNIRVSDVVRQVGPEDYIQDGENYSRGVEFSITAAPVQGLNIIAGYSYNESEIVKAGSNSIQESGRRPEEAGPKSLVNGWISYRFSQGTLDGFGLGFGGNYASDNYIVNRQSTGQFILPAYTVLNASVFYDTEKYRLDLKVNNFTDKEYYNGWSTINPQAPRNITASFSYKF